jgi:hypothetical protein
MEFHSAGAGESDALEKAFVGFTTVHWQIPEGFPKHWGRDNRTNTLGKTQRPNRDDANVHRARKTS